jgi:hypothetical protein
MELENITREEMLANIHRERKLLEDVLSQIDLERYLTPAFDGGWSIKDVLAHIVHWEQLMITWLRGAAKGALPNLPASDQDVNALNLQAFEENKNLPLDDVLESFNRSYPQAFAIAENSPDALIFTKNPLPGREQPFWITIAANTWWHYQEHREAFEGWLADQSKLSD